MIILPSCNSKHTSFIPKVSRIKVFIVSLFTIVWGISACTVTKPSAFPTIPSTPDRMGVITSTSPALSSTLSQLSTATSAEIGASCIQINNNFPIKTMPDEQLIVDPINAPPYLLNIMYGDKKTIFTGNVQFITNSPDGKWFVYSEYSPNQALYLQSADGQQRRRLLGKWDGKFFYANWINNQQLMVNYYPDPLIHIHDRIMLNPFTGEQREYKLEDFIEELYFGSGIVSPDPTQSLVAYSSDENTISLLNRKDQKVITEVKDYSGLNHVPLWSQDGTDFIIVAEKPHDIVDENMSNLLRVTREGEVQQITHFEEKYSYVDINLENRSPDGQKIVFWLQTKPDVSSGMWVIINLKSAPSDMLCIEEDQEGWGDTIPVWSPDSRFVAMAKLNGDNTGPVILMDTQEKWAAKVAEDAHPIGWLDKPNLSMIQITSNGTAVPSPTPQPTPSPILKETSSAVVTEEPVVESSCLQIKDSPPVEARLDGRVVFGPPYVQTKPPFLLDLATGAETMYTNELENYKIFDVATSPDGKWLVFDKYPKDLTMYIAQLPDGNKYFESSYTPKVEFYLQSADGQHRKNIPGQWNGIYFILGWLDNQNLAVVHYLDKNPYGRTVILNPFTGQLREYKLEDMDQYAKYFNTVDRSESINLMPDPSQNLIVYPRDDNQVILWDLNSKKTLAKLEDHSGFAHNPMWSLDGLDFVIVASSQDGNNSNSEEFFRVTHKGDVQQITHLAERFKFKSIRAERRSPDGQQVAFWLQTQADSYSGIWVVENLKSPSEMMCVQGPMDIDIIAPVWSPDSRYLVVSKLFDREKGPVILVDTQEKWAAKISEDAFPQGWLINVKK